MDYSQFRVLELRRKFFKMFGPEISITDPATNTLVGYIKMKAWKLRGDIRVFTDQTMQREIVRIGGRQVFGLNRAYDLFDSFTGNPLVVLRFRGLRTYFVRGHVDILDPQGNAYGYVQETSSELAIIRRWIGVVPLIGPLIELILAFIPQTFDIMYTPMGGMPQLAGKIVHRKNPVIVKMLLDTTQAQVLLDPRITIGVGTLLSILDANKNS